MSTQCVVSTECMLNCIFNDKKILICLTKESLSQNRRGKAKSNTTQILQKLKWKGIKEEKELKDDMLVAWQCAKGPLIRTSESLAGIGTTTRRNTGRML